MRITKYKEIPTNVRTVAIFVLDAFEILIRYFRSFQANTPIEYRVKLIGLGCKLVTGFYIGGTLWVNLSIYMISYYWHKIIRCI